MELIGKLKNEGHVVFLDRLYCSYSLIQEALREKNTYVCGTTRNDRGFPLHLQEGNVDLEPGEWLWSIKNGVAAYSWMDSAHAQLLSSFHEPELATVLRRVRGQAGKITRLSCSAFKDFNIGMGGNDTGDMLRSRMSVHLKSNKWWKSLFYFVIDQALIATYRIWQELRPLSKFSMRKIIADIILEDNQQSSESTDNTIQFKPSRLTKNDKNKIDSIDENVHHQLNHIEDTKFKWKGCFRCRVKGWTVTKVKSYCPGCSKYICESN